MPQVTRREGREITLHFTDVGELKPEPTSEFKQIHGYTEVRHLLPLFDSLSLAANPRLAKWGPVAQAIFDSLKNTPELFALKSKGILLAANDASKARGSENTYRLAFQEPGIEGVLDGGHNLLAIGAYMLDTVGFKKRVRNWDFFQEHYQKLRQTLANAAEAGEEKFRVGVPIEIVYPAIRDSVTSTRAGFVEISAARNNNAQLRESTKANWMGLFEPLKEMLPEELSSRVEWKSGEPGRSVSPADLVALAWVPLTLLKEQGGLPEDVKAPPLGAIYANKTDCVEYYRDLMKHPEVSERKEGSPHYTIHHPGVLSALKIAADLTRIYDKMYVEFPSAYKNVGGHIGRMKSVKMYDPKRAKEGKAEIGKGKYYQFPPKTAFYRRPLNYTFSGGFLIPLVWGLQALMEVENGQVRWRVEDPEAWLDEHYENVMAKWRSYLEAIKFDPGTAGKSPASYSSAISWIELIVLGEHTPTRSGGRRGGRAPAPARVVAAAGGREEAPREEAPEGERQLMAVNDTAGPELVAI